MRDPREEVNDEDDLAESRLVTQDTLMKHATGLSPQTFLVEQWSHFFAHKSQKQVVKIEPDRQLVHAIGIEDRTMQTYTYETLVVAGDFAEQSRTDLVAPGAPKWPNRIAQSVLLRRALCPFVHYRECNLLMGILSRAAANAAQGVSKPRRKVLALGMPHQCLERYMDFL